MFRLRCRQEAHEFFYIPATCCRISAVSAQKGINVLPLCSRRIIIEIIANVFSEVG